MRSRLIPVLAWALLVISPLCIAIMQLDSVAEKSIWLTLADFENRFQTSGSLWFTFYIAGLSTLMTLVIGIPLAWNLGRYRWPGNDFLRSLFTVPFVMPSILVAMGFLAILDWIELGFGLNSEWLSEARIWALLLAHAWFNLALVIRFCEPLLSTLDPAYEEAGRLLPRGRTRVGRIRRIWAPLMWPNVAAAAALTFVFSFTSFALVKFLTPANRNLEVVMSNQASWAGIPIPSLGRAPSEIVLAASLVQLLAIVIALGISSWLQSRAAGRHLTGEIDTRQGKSLRSMRGAYLLVMAAFVIAPMLALITSSFQIRTATGMEWSLEGWQAAFAGSQSATDISEALISSLGYAIGTLLLALPLGYILADTVFRFEVTRPRLALMLDMLIMLPLALSAVMVGLGVLVGLVRTEPELARTLWIPMYGHLMLTTPFVVRVLLPAMRGLNPDFENAASLLGAGPLRRLFSIRLPLLTPSLIVAASLVVAISLGEFGASWVVLRFTEFTTLPVLVGDLLSRPGFDPTLRAAANVAGTILLLLTMLLYLGVERFRPIGRGGEF